MSIKKTFITAKLNLVAFWKDLIRILISPVWLLDEELKKETKNILINVVQNGSSWLDVGCGLKPFSSSFDNAYYTGIDIETSGRPEDMKVPDKYFDGVNIPYEDCKFDGILCTQVLEHVENFDELLVECNRVMKQDGYFVLSVPFLYREHEQPYDFRRFTSFGLVMALERNGFKVVNLLKCLSAIETIATIISVYISNSVGNKNRFTLVFFGLFLIFPFLALSKILARILPDSEDLYCVLITTAVKKSHIN